MVVVAVMVMVAAVHECMRTGLQAMCCLVGIFSGRLAYRRCVRGFAQDCNPEFRISNTPNTFQAHAR